jgi:FkbM family methyltransferase
MANLFARGSFCNTIMRQTLAKGGGAIDGGANDGHSALDMLRAGADYVISFEPSPGLANAARALIKETEYFESWVLFEMGLSDRSETLYDCAMVGCWTLSPKDKPIAGDISPSALKYQASTFDVKLGALDSAIHSLDLIRYLKLDIEGYEFRAMKGAARLLKECKPVIVLELSCYVKSIGDNPYDFVDYLYHLPYSWYDNDGQEISRAELDAQYPFHSSCDIVGIPIDN